VLNLIKLFKFDLAADVLRIVL